MEHFYQIAFNNGKEFFISSDYDTVELFIYNVYESGNMDGFIAFQSEAKTPLYIRKEEIFSIQSISKEVIGNQTRKWRLV